MELKRCTVIDMRWKRKLRSRLSPEIDTILRPRSEKKAIDDSFNGINIILVIIEFVKKRNGVCIGDIVNKNVAGRRHLFNIFILQVTLSHDFVLKAVIS